MAGPGRATISSRTGEHAAVVFSMWLLHSGTSSAAAATRRHRRWSVYPPGSAAGRRVCAATELASLAGISVEYLTRIEQGRDRNPSVQVINAIADALRLDTGEREHLRYLTKASNGHCVAPSPPSTEVRPPVQAVLNQIEPGIAVVTNRLGDLLAYTSGFDRLTRPLGLLDDPAPNLTRYVFTDERARDAFPDWELIADQRAFDLWLGPSAERSEQFRAGSRLVGRGRGSRQRSNRRARSVARGPALDAPRRRGTGARSCGRGAPSRPTPSGLVRVHPGRRPHRSCAEPPARRGGTGAASGQLSRLRFGRRPLLLGDVRRFDRARSALRVAHQRSAGVADRGPDRQHLDLVGQLDEELGVAVEMMDPAWVVTGEADMAAMSSQYEIVTNSTSSPRCSRSVCTPSADATSWGSSSM